MIRDIVSEDRRNLLCRISDLFEETCFKNVEVSFDVKRTEEIYSYIKRIIEAYKRTKESNLRFSYTF